MEDRHSCPTSADESGRALAARTSSAPPDLSVVVLVIPTPVRTDVRILCRWADIGPRLTSICGPWGRRIGACEGAGDAGARVRAGAGAGVDAGAAKSERLATRAEFRVQVRDAHVGET